MSGNILYLPAQFAIMAFDKLILKLTFLGVIKSTACPCIYYNI